jgi:hypothetical protein
MFGVAGVLLRVVSFGDSGRRGGVGTGADDAVANVHFVVVVVVLLIPLDFFEDFGSFHDCCGLRSG